VTSSYRDAAQHHLPRTAVSWAQYVLVPTSVTSIPLTYTLFDEFASTNNNPVPIQGNAKTLNFTCTTANASCTGDVSGGPWSQNYPYTASGSGIFGAQVKFFFTSFIVQPTPTAAKPRAR